MRNPRKQKTEKAKLLEKRLLELRRLVEAKKQTHKEKPPSSPREENLSSPEGERRRAELVHRLSVLGAKISNMQQKTRHLRERLRFVSASRPNPPLSKPEKN
ncbi:MAG: hypothetical protein FWC18_01595 [Cystobacterineae bacterium]|nr:hypothetical protein [Cystobacterineae bacterium]